MNGRGTTVFYLFLALVALLVGLVAAVLYSRAIGILIGSCGLVLFLVQYVVMSINRAMRKSQQAEAEQLDR